MGVVDFSSFNRKDTEDETAGAFFVSVCCVSNEGSP